MASQLLRQTALARTAQAQQQEKDEYERAIIAMERKITEQTTEKGESNWQEGKLAARYGPPPVCPVVVGDRSLFKRAEDISSFFGAVDRYPTSAVIEIDDDLEFELIDHPENTAEIISSKVNLPTVPICDVDCQTYNDIEFLTKGQKISIWFQGASRDAWLPSTLLQPHPLPSDMASESADKVPATGKFPVLIGNLGGEQSMFKTVEDLRDFLHLSHVPEVIQTTATNVTSDEPWKSGHGRLHEQHYPSRLVAFINADQRRELQSRTRGRKILVWFPTSIPRYAWAPWDVVTEDETKDVAEDNTQDTSTTAADVSAFSNESSTSDEYHDMEKQKEKQQVKAKSPQCALWRWVSGMYQKVTTKLRR
ncbi:hypothetical protein V8F06_005501 [Rhypophila decipiens]